MNLTRYLVFAVAACAACAPAGPAPDTQPAPAGPRLSEQPVTPEQQAGAAELYAAARRAFDEERLDRADSLVARVVETMTGTPAAVPALLLGARIDLARGDFARAIERAERYAGLYPAGASEAAIGAEIARAAAAALAARAPITVGAILPASGPAQLRRYGELVREGFEVAFAEAARRGRDVRLIIADDRGEPAEAALAMRALEDSGAVAVLGPLLTEALVAAARARSRADLPLISPTASELAGDLPNTYSLNTPDEAVAALLGRHAAATGVRRAALLYPADARHEAEAGAFRAALAEGGGQVVEAVGFAPGTTTFDRAMARIADARPGALFVTGGERDLRQIAPQLRFYGLDTLGIRLLGGEGWTVPSVLRAAGAAGLPPLTAALTQPRPGLHEGLDAFVRAYEALYRKSLTSPYPALGYDAALLVLAAIERGGNADIAQRLGETRAVEAASGTFTTVAGALRRAPMLVSIRGGTLEALNGEDAMNGEGAKE